MDALQAGLGSEQGQAAVNDIANFATGGVTILLRRDRLTQSGRGCGRSDAGGLSCGAWPSW